MDDASITYLVLGAAVALFVWNRLPVGVVAIGAALALYATGVISAEEAFSGFGDQTVVFIAALFIVSAGLEAADLTSWAGQRLTGAAGGGSGRLVVALLTMTAIATAIITVNGAVAAILPMAVVIAMRIGRSPSELLIPVAFAGHAGSLLALTGTPVNIIIADAAADAGSGRFGFFEFALAGVPFTLLSVVLLVVAGPRLLPKRTPRVMPADFSDHARTLLAQYGDAAGDAGSRGELYTRASGVAEVVIPPRSELIGDEAFPGMVTESGDLVVLAVHRQGEDTGPRPVTLAAGDTLLLEGSWQHLDEHLGDPEVLVVDEPAAIRRQAAPLGRDAWLTTAVVVAMIVLLAGGLVPAAVAGVLAAGALIVGGVLAADEAHRSIAWSTIFLIAGMLPVATAIRTTGAGDDVAGALVGVVEGGGPYALLIGLFLITTVFSQVISNTATALVMIPIAVAAAGELEISPAPVLMSLAVASAGAFLTPIATPANLMVQEPGGYRFGDYWRLGLPMLGLFFVIAVFYVPLIWSF